MCWKEGSPLQSLKSPLILQKTHLPFSLEIWKSVNGIITSTQFGFRPKLPTGMAMAHFTDNILQNMDIGRFTGAVFLDLSKAFDMVDHHLLLQKLMNTGLPL